MYHLEDTNENVSSYGNHDSTYTVIYAVVILHNLFMRPNSFTNLIEIGSQDLCSELE